MPLPPLHPALRVSCVAIAAALTATAAGASPYSDINQAATSGTVTVHRLRGGVSMLEGSGGNISVLADPKGLLLVDTGIAVSRAKIETALKSLSPAPLRYAVDTHWHWDHTDGNGWVRHRGAAVFASRSTVQHLRHTIRVEEWDHTFPPVPPRDLPNVIVTSERRLRVGRERVHMRPYGSGHTDGDLAVYFEKADVLATGDTFWNGAYPFIDYVAGGGIDGAIRQADANLAMAGPHTLIIPGHGPVADRQDARAFRDMLVEVRGRVAALKGQGKSLSETQAARPTADFDAHWGGSVISGALFTALVYRGV